MITLTPITKLRCESVSVKLDAPEGSARHGTYQHRVDKLPQDKLKKQTNCGKYLDVQIGQ
jgi:hypothetical protein